MRSVLRKALLALFNVMFCYLTQSHSGYLTHRLSTSWDCCITKVENCFSDENSHCQITFTRHCSITPPNETVKNSSATLVQWEIMGFEGLSANCLNSPTILSEVSANQSRLSKEKPTGTFLSPFADCFPLSLSLCLSFSLPECIRLND